MNPKRSAFIDKCKFVLITLVIIGHLIERIKWNSHIIRGTFLFIYSFHMPLFVMISGYLSKPEIGWDGIAKVFSRLLAPLFVFHVLYWTLEKFVFKGQVSLHQFLTVPFYPLWFLLSLACWKLILPFCKSKFLIPISFIAALFCGFSNLGMEFSLSRTITFLPFFLIGYHLKNERAKFPKINPVFLVPAFILFLVFALKIDHRWLYGAYSYKELGLSFVTGPLLRSAWYLIAFTMSFSFCSLITERESIITDLGTRSIYAYILHIPIDRFLSLIGFYKLPSLLIFPPLILSGIAISFSLSSKTVREKTRFLIEPNFQGLNKFSQGKACKPLPLIVGKCKESISG